MFEEDQAEICKSGMHFCKNPLDVLNYYPLVDNDGKMSEFSEVEALDEVKTDDGKKYCTKKLKVGAKLSFAKLVQASVSFDIGSWITLSEWEYSEEEKAHIPVCVKTVKIDGVKIKEDTYYKLENGRFKQVKQGGTR